MGYKYEKQNYIEDGSIQNIPNIPVHIKEIYKTVWEVGNKTLIKMAVAQW